MNFIRGLTNVRDLRINKSVVSFYLSGLSAPHILPVQNFFWQFHTNLMSLFHSREGVTIINKGTGEISSLLYAAPFFCLRMRENQNKNGCV